MHISFVRSTVLDKCQQTQTAADASSRIGCRQGCSRLILVWIYSSVCCPLCCAGTADQMLLMVVGGNANAAAYFKAKGWNDDSGADSQSGAKFTSKAAVAYKAHLEKEVAKNRDRLIDTLNESFGQDPAAAEAAAAAAAGPKTDALDAEIAKLSLARPAKPTPSPPLPSSSSSSSPPLAVSTSDEPKATEQQPKAPVRTVIRKVHAPAAVTASAASTDDAAASAPAAASAASSSAADSFDGFSAADVSTSVVKKPTASASSMRSQLSTKKVGGKTSILASSSMRSARGAPADDLDPFEAAAREAADSANRAQQEKADAALRAANPPAPSPKAKEIPKKPAKDDPDANLAKYAKSTSISSDQYFERDSYAKTDEVDRARLSQFSNANAIGSDQYFDRNQEEGGRGGGHDPDLSDAVAQTVSGIKGLAKGLFKGIQSRYG